MTYTGRFAPSPTGMLHLGTARTALCAWWAARAVGGRFILRMEDLDPPRVVAGAADAILEDLSWLGLDWDEGPDMGGPHAPYAQSRRDAFYREALRTFVKQDLVYACWCSRRELRSISSAPHGLGDEGPRYPGTCARLDEEQRRRRAAESDRAPSLRFRAPAGTVTFEDRVAGVVAVDVRETAGDFVVRRSDGLFAYQLAVVVDDALMGVTEVVRGADLLSSTARQIALHRALGHEPPRFAHVPLVLGDDGTRLAKRHGAPSVRELRLRGETPERIVGPLAASLGLLASPEPASAPQLVTAFSWDAIRDRATDHVAW